MAYYELTTLHLTFAGAVPAAGEAIRYATEPNAAGRLLGCWRPEIGSLNKLVILRHFANERDLIAERIRLRTGENPFNCGGLISGIDIESFVPFPGFERIEPGSFGKLYEMRTYATQPDGLGRLVPDWGATAPKRDRISKLLLAMYGLDGPSRMVHICPYESMEHRSEIRATLVREAADWWPPKSGPTSVEPRDMRSTLLIPVPQSPLN